MDSKTLYELLDTVADALVDSGKPGITDQFTVLVSELARGGERATVERWLRVERGV